MVRLVLESCWLLKIASVTCKLVMDTGNCDTYFENKNIKKNMLSKHVQSMRGGIKRISIRNEASMILVSKNVFHKGRGL